jgi:hypothetical protein
MRYIVDGTALTGGRMGTNEATGDLIVEITFGDQISGELTEKELVIGRILIEQIDDSIPIGPHLTIVVEVKAVGVGIACRVEPHPSPVFSEARRVEQAVEYSPPGIWFLIFQERIDFRQGGR